MQYIEGKLNSGDPVLVTQALSRLIARIGSKQYGKQEFAYLKDKCLSENGLISDTARLSIVKLVEIGALQLEQVLTEFVTSISTASNVTSLAKIIVSLLNLQLYLQREDKERSLKKQYLMLQHPIIKILQAEASANVQISIYNGIIQSYHQNPSLLVLVNQLYEPLFLYCICSPMIKVEISLLKQKLWAFLVKCDEENGTDYIFQLCCWMQMQSKNCELAALLLDEVLQAQLNGSKPLNNLHYLVLMQILIINHMIANHMDFKMIIKTVLLAIPKVSYCHNNVALLILSSTLISCSPLYLEDLLKLCFSLANHNVCRPYSYLALKSMVLHWLAGPCILTETALKVAQNILQLNDHVCRERPLILVNRLSIDKFHYLTFCQPEVFFAMHLAIKVDCTKDEEISTFLQDFQEVPVHQLKSYLPFLCGLLIEPKLSAENKLQVLDILLKCSKYCVEILPQLLTLILYMLSNNEDSNLHFKLLKSLPLMAMEKENVPKVIATIQAISKQSPTLNNFALRLIYDTWEIDGKCYSALESIVLQENDGFEFERNISRAYIFKNLAEKRPELYGKDLVAHLSKILNQSTTTEGSVACALALEGIKHLCKAEIIDIVTTWDTLAPKFKEDTRVLVVKSLCDLIKEIPSLEYAQSYERLNDEVVQLLWNYVITSSNEEIVSAAIEALAGFNLDLICLHMPESYLEDDSSKQSSLGEQRIIPGKAWLKFLSSHQFKNQARNFIEKLIRNETENYLKYVYQVKARKEPESYAGLPSHSIVRALGEFLKRNFEKVKSWENTPNGDLYMDCLKILSLKYPKPLPPLDWCFLQELVHVPSLKPFCLALAAHQAILSGSARRLMENYIVATTDNPTTEASLSVYKNLKYLANSIQPMMLRPFFEASLYPALQTVELEQSFEEIIACLIEVLEDDEVQDVNKNVIEEVLTDIVFVTNISSKAFPLLLKCIPSFTYKGLEKVSRFNLDIFKEEEFIKMTKIRCHICQHTSESPLLWLNDIFAVACRNNVQLHVFYSDLTSALKKQAAHEDSPVWLNELFGEIQAKVAERCESSEIGFFCDILAIAVLHFSGLFVLLPRYGYDNSKYFLPASLTYLLDEPSWSICTSQVLEWLHHMSTAESIPNEYKHIFGWALASLRHQEDFSKSSRWMKYLDCQIYTGNKF